MRYITPHTQLSAAMKSIQRALGRLILAAALASLPGCIVVMEAPDPVLDGAQIRKATVTHDLPGSNYGERFKIRHAYATLGNQLVADVEYVGCEPGNFELYVSRQSSPPAEVVNAQLVRHEPLSWCDLETSEVRHTRFVFDLANLGRVFGMGYANIGYFDLRLQRENDAFRIEFPA